MPSTPSASTTRCLSRRRRNKTFPGCLSLRVCKNSMPIGRGRRLRRPVTMLLYLCLPRWGRTGTETHISFPAGNITLAVDEVSLTRKRVVEGADPYRICAKGVHTVMRRLSPAATKPSPLGKCVPEHDVFLMSFPYGKHHGRRMRACRQPAQHCAMVTCINPSSGADAPASPKGNLKSTPKNKNQHSYTTPQKEKSYVFI